MDLEKLLVRAKKLGMRRGLEDEAEDFAQEAAIYAWQKELKAMNLEYFYRDYLRKLSTDSRVLGSNRGSVTRKKDGKKETICLTSKDAVLSGTEDMTIEDTVSFSSFDSGFEVVEKADEIEKDLNSLFSKVSDSAKAFLRKNYQTHLMAVI